ncbi:Stabilin-2 [Microtus ochrogaster]|uniref:Stabilin-2 n=1 Tax=Microtus ochrogaster TaxID=79684 RepID=A0A8J6GSN8_MICOH|nr:Stabilin-2 [Microtus ochrogaster]
MLLPLIPLFLGLAVQNTCTPAEATELVKRCDKKSFLTIRTECQACSANFAVKCPVGYVKITNDSLGVRDCRLAALVCCPFRQRARAPQHGTNSLAFTSHSSNGLEYRGGDFTPKLITTPSSIFHPSPTVCSCVHGVCNSGLNGDGTCECFSAYRGPRCDKPINPCLKSVCHPHASCTYLGPNRHRCSCQKGYRGDGQVCLPVDPCQTNFGNCSTKSTVCKYDGPGQSHCECKEHYRDFVPGVGCSMINVCESNNPCHKNANCSTVAPGQAQCTCRKGYIGDGLTCYGNIMERLRELNTEPRGMWQGRLTSFISILDRTYAWPLSNLGPFTVLLPSDKGLKGFNVKELLMDNEAARYFVKLHIIAGQMSTRQMNDTDAFYTLTGKPGEIFNRDKDNQLKLKLDGGEKVKIIQGDIAASNGLIHILDRAMDKTEPTLESNPEQTIMKILQPRFGRFSSLLEKTNVGHTLDEGGAGDPYTIFVPSNEALDSMKEGTMDYLLSPQGSRKLLELVRYHIVAFTQLEVATLVSTPHIRTMANQFVHFNITRNGRILVNDVAVEETEVAAKNGRIYTLTGVLVPPSIVPILPHRCDETKREMRLVLFTRNCVYRSRTQNLKSGCAQYCNTTIKIPKCCSGFFGPDCNPCPGGFLNPCSGNGQCIDGLRGNGTCICEDGFQGSRCQFCSDPNRYGPRCNRTCLCVHGACDNRVDSDGACLSGTCREGTSGRFCDKKPSACGPYVQLCHIHATCKYSNGTASCVCNEGYEGDGTLCSKKDPCVGSTSRGGCSPNAECIRTGTGAHVCVCQQGWTGDGRDCVAINNCLLPGTGGCHDNATCLYIGPGQVPEKEVPGKEVPEKEVPGKEVPEKEVPEKEVPGKEVPGKEVPGKENECECKKGFRGNGIDCEPVISCLEQAEKCHPLATCQADASGVWSCVCQEGYEGNGLLCYGNMLMDASLQSMLSATPNLTVLVPSRQAIEDMDKNERTFWLSRNNIPALIKYHTVRGTYGGADLQNLSSSDMLATSLQGSFLRLDKADGNITIEGASIVDGDNAATNGVIHVINKQYNLASAIEAADAYTVFAPNNEAIESYIREKKATTLEEDVLRYHVVLEEKLLKNDLHNGMHRETMLGFSYLLGFFLHNDQLFVNDAPINYTNVATDKGVIHGLGKVLEIQKNRCDENDTTIVRTKACCAGFFGPQCQACPRKDQNVCSGNGFCLDGVNGIGTCRCEQGFNGTACESCVEDRYGVHCDQACSCVHGRCNQGPSGDGSCDCDVGWRGVHCDIAVFSIQTAKPRANARQDSKGMEQSAQAGGAGSAESLCGLRDPTGPQEPVPATGAINACEVSNGGCSAKADCKRTTPGSRVCVCKAGYTGDGIVCLEINPCLENNGGCDRNAECTQTGPNQAVCNCLPKFTGDGKACTLINVCLTNNGGCSPFATCTHTGQDQRICTCKQNYTGDGFVCRSSIYGELPQNPTTSQYFFQLQEHAVRELAGPGPFTVFAPSSASFDQESRIKDWDAQGLMSQVLRYHVVACQQLLLENLKVTTSAVTLQGEPISISVSQDSNKYVLTSHGPSGSALMTSAGSVGKESVQALCAHVYAFVGLQGAVYINNKAKVLSGDIISTNGVIHIIDRLLSPQNLLVTPKDASGRVLNLTTVAMNRGYTRFSKLIQDSGLLSVITDPIHTPVTLFWPTDKALQALPPEQRDFLFDQDNKDKLKEYLKFHVIRDSKALASDLPRSASWKTLQGSELSITCGTGRDVGELFLNGQMCRITQRGLLFDLGVAYGIDCLLTNPTLGGRCDTFTTFNVSGVKQKCFYKSLPFGKNLEGCRQLCTLVIRLPRCCKGYFLPHCQACPGGPDTPCNNRGVCSHLYSTTGQCQCNTGFNGTACELCWPGRFGPDCQPCGCSEHGQCDEGITGSGQCFCEAGWTGRFCDSLTAVFPVCIPPCSVHATCMENNTCVCNLNYEGDGITCTAVDFCKQNNGGCAKAAKCSQQGTQVSCSCKKGYQGDGYSCMEIDPCADGVNGGCHEHATCRMTGPGRHKCECKSHYVGDGVDCEPEQLPLDRCLQDNGQCHPDANCADLHFQDTTVGVFHLRSPLGQYKLTFDKAKEACANEAASMATYNQLSYAQKASYHLCSAGWLESGRVAYPTTFASQKCGSNVVGIVDYGNRPNRSETWDVFCYRMKDVNCTCKAGYVGDGFSCSGNMLQVLMSLSSLTDFLAEVLAYSNSSARGRAFLKHLTDLSIRGTLFVPQNSGLMGNKSLSGRDIEHHLTNVSVSFYDDLVNGTVLRTRLGSQLLITSRQDQLHQETRFVDGRAILQWDIIASNGLLHVISEPLKAPPVPASPAHTGLRTGVVCAVILVTGAIALVAYSYFRLNQRTTGFQRFESEEDIDVLAFGKQQPENVTNPVYESSSAAPPESSCDPFPDPEEQEVESSDPLGALRP